MNKILSAALLGVALFGSAFAQQKWDFTPYGYSFRLGVAFPQSAATRGGDEMWNAIGVDYNLDSSVLRRGDSFLSLDMIMKEFGGQGGTIWSAMINNRFYTTEGDTRNYFIGGLGFNIINVNGSEMLFGGRFGYGMEMSQQMFLQGVYTFGAKGDLSPENFGVYVGYRF